MKIAIFENEYKSVKLSFEACNSILFENKLKLVNFTKSQDFDFEQIKEFDVFFVDIDLSVRSDLDGYKLIKLLIEIDPMVAHKIIVLTGNNKIVENLNNNGIIDPIIHNNIVMKPTNFFELGEAINKVSLK